MFDAIIFGFFIVITLFGVGSIFFNSSNELAYIQLALTLIGLLIGLKQIRPGIFRKLGAIGKLGNTIGKTPLRAFSIVLLAAIVSLQTITWLNPPSRTCACTLPPVVTITSPLDGSKVSQVERVEGTASNIPETMELWLFIIAPSGTDYFPQRGGPIDTSSGHWSAEVQMGTQGEFQLIPVLVGKKNTAAQETIKKYFEQPGPDYKPIPLPNGAMKLRAIHVMRSA